MKERTTLNLVSGKGGTGKTLFAAVLAEMLGSNGYETIVVDLDAFVRGLTALLYYHKQGALNLSDKKHFTISDFFIAKGNVQPEYRKISISRYLSFDVVPSVSRVDQLLTFGDLVPDNKNEAFVILKKLLNYIPNKYDFVILDSRAGYDELIAATHLISDVSICIEEEDDISKITTDNLIRQLQSDSDNPLFRVVNKATSAKSIDELMRHSSIVELGRIPFDMDIMKGFGGARFWEETEKSLYKAAVGHIWNGLCQKLSITKTVQVSRIGPIGSEETESRLQLLSSRDRIIFFYGCIFGLLGLIAGILGGDGLRNLIVDPIQSISLLLGFLGISAAISVVFKGKPRQSPNK